MYALIPCAGSGARAGSSEPKQYRDIAGVPMVIHTLRAFDAVARIKQGMVVVGGKPERMGDLAKNELSRWARVVEKAGIKAEN